MRVHFAHRLLLTVLPAIVIASIALSTVWGSNGLVARYHLKAEIDTVEGRLATVDRENQRLVREIDLLDKEPLATERVVAEELAWARPGTTLYTFDAPRASGDAR